MNYSERLRHPKWQAKRLRVLEAKGFECEECEAREKTLHVHHGYYRSAADPWDYEDDTLHSLCESCHALAEEARLELLRNVGRLKIGDIWELVGFLIGRRIRDDGLPEGEAVVSLPQTSTPDASFYLLSGLQDGLGPHASCLTVPEFFSFVDKDDRFHYLDAFEANLSRRRETHGGLKHDEA